jgi:hypothetical protein
VNAVIVGGLGAAGEEPVMADAMEALWKQVNEEASDELVGVERHGGAARPTLDAVVLDLEGHAGGIGLDETAVRDGDAVGVARQIGEDRLRTCERALGVDEPALLSERGEERRERLGVCQMRMGGEEPQLDHAALTPSHLPKAHGAEPSHRRGGLNHDPTWRRTAFCPSWECADEVTSPTPSPRNRSDLPSRSSA